MIDSATAGLRPGTPYGRFLRLSRGFWTGRTRALAFALSAAILALLVATLLVQVGVNRWNRMFFDALELRDSAGLLRVVWLLPVLVVIFAATQTGMLLARMSLQLKWREWLTRALLDRWITRQRYYRLQGITDDQGAPEYRIAEDVRLSIDPLVDFLLGFLGSIFAALTFAAILWDVAGAISVPIGATHVTIPAYMAVAAVLYAIIVSLLTAFVGGPLIRRIAFKNEREARFRAEMTRLRENAESIALLKGDLSERAAIGLRFQAVIGAWAAIIRQQGIVGIVLNTNGALFPILPMLLIAPKYLSGSLSLGAVMQVIAAFTAVQAALIWFVDNFVRIAEWYASVVRVDELLGALGELDPDDKGLPASTGARITIAEHDGTDIAFHALVVALRSGEVLIAPATLTIERGEKIVLTGESGIGKSTLVRAIAGLWPWGSGRILLPRAAALAFVPQKPYIPSGTLRRVLGYPGAESRHSDGEIVGTLVLCGLGALGARLDAHENWDQILSGGERQRLAIARVILARPDIVILDEATSALDDAGQEELLRLLAERLADATIINVGHRFGPDADRQRQLELTPGTAGANLIDTDPVAIARGQRWPLAAARRPKVVQ